MNLKHTLKKLFALCLSAVLLFSFASCQKSKAKKVNEAFENVLTTQNIGETQTPPKEGVQIAELIFSKMTYTVTEVSDAQCIVTVVAPDVSKIFWDNFNPENYSELSKEKYQSAEEELMNKIKTSLENNNYSLKTMELTVPLVDGKPEITYELADAFYGGLYSLTTELSGYYANGGVE